MPTLPARDCFIDFRSRKFCEPERMNCPLDLRSSARAWIAEKSAGAYWASSMMTWSGSVETKPAGSATARADGGALEVDVAVIRERVLHQG